MYICYMDIYPTFGNVDKDTLGLLQALQRFAAYNCCLLERVGGKEKGLHNLGVSMEAHWVF